MCKTLQSTEEDGGEGEEEMAIPGTRAVTQHNPQVGFGKVQLACRSLVDCGSGSCGSRQVQERLLLAAQVGTKWAHRLIVEVACDSMLY